MQTMYERIDKAATESISAAAIGIPEWMAVYGAGAYNVTTNIEHWRFGDALYYILHPPFDQPEDTYYIKLGYAWYKDAGKKECKCGR